MTKSFALYSVPTTEIALSSTVRAKAKMRPKARGGRVIATTGQTLPDGTIIELVSGSAGNKPDLLHWKGVKASAASRVKYGDYTYEASALAPSLYCATRLPKQCKDYGSSRKLFREVADLFRHSFGFPDRESGLIACFCMSTWLTDRLSVAPILLIVAPDEGLGIEVLRLLGCICRRPLMLAEVTPGGLRSLPMQFSFTLLINEHGLRPNLQRLLRASSYRGLHLPGNRGSVVDLYGPKALLWESDVANDNLGDGVIQISLPPSSSQWPALDEQRQQEIANEFQPCFLMYRLKNWAKVRESRADGSQFTVATRRLACALAACFPDDPDLVADVILLLQPQDEEMRAQRVLDVAYVLVEILWSEIHSREHRQVTLSNLAKDANALLRSRGECIEYSAEMVGWRLKHLHIRKHTDTAGRKVLLDRDTSRRVHCLAQTYDLPRSQHLREGCSDCAASEPPVAK
jgi:hypothetical protein